jgi:hypothetical protein
MEKLVYIWLNDDYQAIIDAEDYDLIAPYYWYPSIRRYKDTYKCYAVALHKKKLVSIHRLLMAHPSKPEVDHINGDSLDNRRCNLRPATREENARNVGVRRDNLTGYKGVTPLNGGYAARIEVNKAPFMIGVYTTAIEAAKAYDSVARKVHKEFCRLNFPDDP